MSSPSSSPRQSPSPRQRPRCKTCKSLMAGHKRPHGWPVCPPRPSPPPPPKVIDVDAAGFDHMPRIGEYLHWVNPNYVENVNPDGDSFGQPRRNGTPSSWVPTELDDDVAPVKWERASSSASRTERLATDLEITRYSSTHSTYSSSSTTSSRLRRTFGSILTNSIPAVSLFSAPRDDMATITQAARLNGLHTGLMRKPRREVKEERGIGRRYSWWVLMGKDPEAVEHLMGLQERDNIAKIENRAQEDAPDAQPADTLRTNVVTITTLQLILCSVIGAIGGSIIFVFILSLL